MLSCPTKLMGALVLGAIVSLAVVSDYGSWSSSHKQGYLWQNVMADTSGGSFMNPLKTIWTVMHSANLWAMTTIHADWREASHCKATHGVGAVAKAHFEWEKNEYTGMFQKADNCVIRMANAAVPGGIAMTSYGPNLAVKCLRDGEESANMQFIWMVDGYAVIPKGAQSSCSYFETPLSNHNPLRDDIAMPLNDTFIKAFQGVDPQSMFVGVSQFASGEQNGTSGDVKSPHFPFALVLQPAEGLNSVPCTFDKPISQLLNLAASGLGVAGKTLYTVFAVRDPSESPQASSLQRIGTLVLDSSFTSSTYGDHQLFFRHTFFKDELDLLRSTDPQRAATWSDYVTKWSNYQQEGANLYWPLLPGGQAQLAELASRKPMLATDVLVV